MSLAFNPNVLIAILIMGPSTFINFLIHAREIFTQHELINGLINATKILKKNGKIVVVSFHSLEDKIVKYFFKNLSENRSSSRYVPKINDKINLLKLINKKPIMPSEAEIKKNPPSRSAKLRSAIKQYDITKVETDIYEKFKNLLEIENYSKKL